MSKDNKKKSIFKYMNKGILFISLAFIIVGAFCILDASSISSVLRYQHDTPYYFFEKQLIWIAIGFVGALFLLKIPTKAYKGLSLIGSLALIGILGVTLVGTTITGNISTVTITIGSITFQPAEILKVTLVMYTGAFYSDWVNSQVKSKVTFFAPIILWALSIGLVLLGGDVGTGIIMCLLLAITFVVIPTKDQFFKYFKIGAYFGMAVIVGVLLLSVLFIDEDSVSYGSRPARLYYKDACDRYEDTGYQVCNGYIAMDNGGLTGVGLGNSTQKYLYLDESHTDFIFPIIVEEFGIISGIIIIIFYIILLYLIFRVASNTNNLRNSIVCYGLGIYFMLHIFINLGGILGLMPITGVPLPFLSYGGSFCISMIGAFAIIQRINIESKMHYEKLEKPLK